MCQTRFPKKASPAALQTDPIKQTHHNPFLLLTNLEKESLTFDKTKISLIEKIHFLTDLKSLAKEILNDAHVVFAAEMNPISTKSHFEMPWTKC